MECLDTKMQLTRPRRRGSYRSPEAPTYLPTRLCAAQSTMLNLKVKPEKERVAFKHGVIEWMVDQQKCSSPDRKANVKFK